jgi:hypothetical protein
LHWLVKVAMQVQVLVLVLVLVLLLRHHQQFQRHQRP